MTTRDTTRWAPGWALCSMLCWAVLASAGLLLTRVRAAWAETPASPNASEPGAKHVGVLTQLTWVLGDDDVQRRPSEAVPASPAPSLGERLGFQLIGDQLQSRRSVRDNWVLWTSQASFRGYIPRITTSAVLALGFDLAGASQAAASAFPIEDAGTHLALRYEPAPKHEIELQGFPLDSNQLRLGYLYPLTYGGTDWRGGENAFPRAVGAIPGVRASYRGPAVTSYVALKTAEIPEPVSDAGSQDSATTLVNETNYGVLAGVEWRPYAWLGVGGQGAYVEQGRFPFADVSVERVFSLGAALRVTLGQGLLPDDPLTPRWQFGGFPAHSLDVGLSAPGQRPPAWLLSVEATELWQRLRRFEAVSGTELQPARAAAVQGMWLVGRARVGVLSMLREPAFVLRYGPSLVPFQTLPARVGLGSQLLTTASFALAFKEDQWRPGLQLGLELPAGITSSTPEGPRTLLLKHSGESTLLGSGRAVSPILHARASLRWAASPGLTLLGWVQYRRDPNGAHLHVDEAGDYRLSPATSADFLGFGLACQARF